MNDSSPPGYSLGLDTASFSPATSPSVLLNLAPLVGSTTFQLGYLGHGPAFIAGDVQIKYAGTAQAKPRCSKLVVSFRGLERVQGAEPIELCEQTEVIWGIGAAGTSSSASSSTVEPADDFPPSDSPFRLTITPDLPVCLHLGTSSLEYHLTAELHFADPALPPIARCAPVHLARSSPLDSSRLMSPSIVSTRNPVAASVKLQRTVFCTGEPVELVARVEIPTAQAVADGLRLRTVSAELVRTIEVRPIAATSSNAATIPDLQHVQRTVLAHSGKSARFSPERPIVIRLVLHPPAELACESITQTTICHTVSFAVKVTIGLFSLGSNAPAPTSGSATAASDTVLTQPITIVPASISTLRTDKQKEAMNFGLEPSGTPQPWSDYSAPPVSPPTESPSEAFVADGPVPSYFENSADDPGVPAAAASSSSIPNSWTRELDPPNGEEEDEEEYDGYEAMSIPTEEAGPPPPAIDEDVSPPSPSEVARTLPLNDLSLEVEDDLHARNDSVGSDGTRLSAEFERGTPVSMPASPPPPLSPDQHLDDLADVTRFDPSSSSVVPVSIPPVPLPLPLSVTFPENLPPPYIVTSRLQSSPIVDGSNHQSQSPSQSRPCTPSSPPPPASRSPAHSPSSRMYARTPPRHPPGHVDPSTGESLRDPPPYREQEQDSSR
ncbi:uncharacterized protein JCM15063_003366 [Sporobolomyces koalae]|uniref:uncharacterized protein n=1 Tax=Sporobolomyces koalae TaxID=500713 RepID=UPI00316F3F27